MAGTLSIVRSRRGRTLAAGLPVAVVLSLSVALAAPAHAAGPCGPPVTSVIACENTQAGDPPGDWQVAGSGSTTIQGFATSMSVNHGETVSFKINTPSTNYHIDILRMGYYQGNGARKVVAGLRPGASLPQSQPPCRNDTVATGLIDCGTWAVSASWAVPATAVSGVYLAHLVRDDASGGSLIPFVVRDDASTSDLLLQTSDETWQAYNTYGGNSLYSCTVNCPLGNPHAYKGAAKVSYNRPFHTADDDAGRSWVMYAEYPMIRFLESNGYDVSYAAGLDVATRGPLLLNHKAFLSSGHDEYWSGDQRASVETARAAGVNLAFFSGNEVFWKTRWEPSIDGSATSGRTLVSYKETHYDSRVDPQDPPTWTGTWADPRFSPPSDGGRPQNALTGQLFVVNAGTTDIQATAQYAGLRFWRNTPAAALTGSQTRTLGPGANTLGYEWDEDADDGFRPAGLMDMSSTTLTGTDSFVDYGSTTASRTATHHLTLYRADSGALVFGAGTVQWAFGLDSANPNNKAADPVMQQATVNLFADMHVQPATPVAGLSLATASADTIAPTSTVTAPAAGSTQPDGSVVTITGTASDAGGGTVAGVEVSTDGGTSWHPATGTTNWTYRWVAHGNPSTGIRTRAVDDSGNLENPTTVTVNVACPCTLWGAGTTPGQADSGDANSIEVGVRFTSDVVGSVNGIRFYKSTANTGTHVGNLWSASGQLLASAVFTGETASGWQQVSFSQAVALSPNTTYIASYFAPKGHYAQDEGYFYPHPAPMPDGNGSTDSRPLHALRNTNGVGNGLFLYTAGGGFPSNTFNGENYWVEPVFVPSGPPGTPTAVTGTAGNASVLLSWTAPTTGGVVTTYTVTPYLGTVAQPTTTVTGFPAPTGALVTGLVNGSTYTFTVSASNQAGTAPPSAPSGPVTPSASATSLANGGFESGTSGWTATGTPSPSASTTRAHTGSGSALLGLLAGTEPQGDSSLSQSVAVPGSGTSSLSFWYWPVTSDGLCTGSACQWDWEEAQIRNLLGVTLATVFKSNSNAQAWTQVTADLTPYAGQTVVLWFNVHSDGASPPDDTAMYLDDVAVTGSQPAAPAAPTGVTATAGNTTATVTWTAPTNGGSPITSYTVTPFTGTTAQTPLTVTGTPPATTATLTGLTNGTAYTFTVTATNTTGTSPASTPSTPVTPTATTAGPVTIDKTVFTDGSGTVTSPALTTAAAGELVVAFVSLDGPSGAGRQTATVSGAGLTWTMARRANTRSGDAEVWWARAASALSAKTVVATPSSGGFHGSLTVVALQNAGGIGTGATAGAASGAPDVQVPGTGLGSWVFAVGNDWDGAVARTPSAGQTIVHQRVDTPVGDTFWVQSTTAPNTASGTTVIHDTAPVADQWNYAAVEVTSGP